MKIIPDKNSHVVVARFIFEGTTIGTRIRILRGGHEGLKDLAILTEGFADEVRKELGKLILAEQPHLDKYYP